MVMAGGLLAQQVGARYLIITHDNFYNFVRPLAEWKNRTGMTCRIVKLSETGSSPDAIRNYIVNAYNSWAIRPEYVLLVGAPNFLPMPMVSGTYSDNYYTNMDGDIFNEILSGRLTVHDTIEAHTVVNKILTYERYPYVADPSWFKKGTLIVNVDNDPPDDSIYWSDLHHAAGLMVANGFTRIDTLSDIYGHNASTVINDINNGRSFLMYRGSGLNNWYTPFGCNPGTATNGARLPIVLSITCQTMGTGSTPAAAEYWLLTGTPTILRGAAGYFATTTAISGGAHLRSAIAKGFFDAAFWDHKRTFGEACEGGRVRVYTLYPGDAHEYYGYTTLGDPEMGLWTDTPCSLAVTHPVRIPIYDASFTIQVTRVSSSNPQAGAFVCVMGKLDTTLYAMDTTDAAGYAHFSVHPQVFNDTVWVTVTGQNLQPYEGMMTASTPNPYIIYANSMIDDSLTGNNDRMMNPGEAVSLPLWVLNIGGDTALDVTGVVRTVDTLVMVTDSLRYFGTIAINDTAFTGSDGYHVAVRPSCPDRHAIDFELQCRDGNDSSWTTHFSHSVAAANLIYQDAIIFGGNGDQSIEPGETVSVAVVVRDIGSAGLDSLHATLRTASSYSGVIDSLGLYPRIGPDSLAADSADPFIIHALPVTPPGTVIEYQMIVHEGYYQDTISFSLIVGQRDYYVWNPDPTPASGDEIDRLLGSLGYNGTIGDTFPTMLEQYHSLFVCLGVYPNRRIVRRGSETSSMRYYLENHHGRIYMEGGDVWYYDPRYNSGYCFDTLFGLTAAADGNPDLGPVIGQTGTFTGTMEFSYGGENAWMDHINPSGGSLIFHDGDDDYNCGVAYDADRYRTVGVSFELGLLIDGTAPSTRRALLDSIMHFFGIGDHGVNEGMLRTSSRPASMLVYPTPFRDRLMIRVSLAQPSVGTLVIYDIAGRQRKTVIEKAALPAGSYEWQWEGTDDHGVTVAEGIYFLRWVSDDRVTTVKTVYLKVGGGHR